MSCGWSVGSKLITQMGGSSGMGLATAKAAKAEGARVVITGRSRERLQAAKTMLGDNVRTVALDIADEKGTRALFSELNSVDHVFITAGTLLFDPKLATDADSVRPALDTRFWGTFNAAKFAGAKTSAGGSITFMSGTAAIRPISGASAATASCGAVEAFGRALAVDLAPIRVQHHSTGPDRYPFPRHSR